MKKPDEIHLYNKLRAYFPEAYRGPGRVELERRAADVGMIEKRLLRLVEKWEASGWWDCGVHSLCGWFTLEAPKELHPHCRHD